MRNAKSWVGVSDGGLCSWSAYAQDSSGVHQAHGFEVTCEEVGTLGGECTRQLVGYADVADESAIPLVNEPYSTAKISLQGENEQIAETSDVACEKSGQISLYTHTRRTY